MRPETTGRPRDEPHALRAASAVAGLALLAALPALGLPFLSDDWVVLGQVEAGRLAVTPFQYVRPLTMAAHAIVFRAFGLAPVAFHAVNAILIAAAAGLVTLLVRRYTSRPGLSFVTGLAFAMHPYHVSAAAWAAALSEPLFTVFFLLAALAYDAWRERPRGIPVAALLSFAASLCSKESAVVLPVFLAAIGWVDSTRRPTRAEALRGLLPMLALALAHFLVVRPALLGHSGLGLLRGLGPLWVAKAAFYSAGAVVPVPAETFVGHRWVWVGSALLLSALLLAAVRRRGPVPKVAIAAAGVYLVLLVPALVAFQERSFFLPGAAAVLALVSLFETLGRRARVLLGGALGLLWVGCAVSIWAGWYEAGHVSRRLVAGLVEASRTAGVEEIVVANVPHRVAHAPVATKLEVAIAVSGGRRVRFTRGAYVDLPDRSTTGLEPLPDAVARGSDAVEVRIRLDDDRGIRRVPSGETGDDGIDRVHVAGDELLVRIARTPGRAAYAWTGDGLARLFGPQGDAPDAGEQGRAGAR